MATKSNSSGKGNAPAGTTAKYSYSGLGYGGGNTTAKTTGSNSSTAAKSTGGGSSFAQTRQGPQIRPTGGVTRVNQGITLSSADYLKGGYGQYQQPPSKTQMAAAKPSPMQQYLNMRQAVDTGAGNTLQRAMAAPAVSMQRNANYTPSLSYGAQKPQKIMASLGDDMAASIEGRVAQRLANPGPLRGVSTQGRTPMVSPMAGQGSPYPGPTSPVAGKAGFPAYQQRLQDTMMANYNRGQTPPTQMAGMPQPTGAPPSRTSLISDDPSSLMSMNTVGRGVGGILGGIVGGPVGGMLGQKLGGIAMDKSQEYGHPLYGYGSGPQQERLSGFGGGGGDGRIMPHDVPPTSNSMVQSTPQQPQGPQGAQAFKPPRGMYPDYYSSWANLPRGLFG